MRGKTLGFRWLLGLSEYPRAARCLLLAGRIGSNSKILRDLGRTPTRPRDSYGAASLQLVRHQTLSGIHPLQVLLQDNQNQVLLPNRRYEPRTGYAPADIAGSAHHPLGPALPGIKLVGCYLGRGDWPSIQAAQACKNRLRPLDMVDLVEDGPSIKNSETLKRQLIERIANSIPTHWLSLMPPCDTELVAIESMARITRSHELLYRYSDSPPERADLAMRQTFLPSPLGGLGSKNFPTNRHAYHAASVYATWRTTARVIPEIASYDLTDEPSSLPRPAAAFATAYRSVIDSHAAVVTAYTAIDAVLLFLVTGGKRRYAATISAILPRRSHIPFPRKPL
jgi:hypothetical protein